MSQPRPRRNAFTIVELLVVIGVIAVLMAVLLPALAGVFKTSQMTSSINNLKQTATYMRLYADTNREAIVPSQFNYTEAAAAKLKITVRSNLDPALGQRYKGTWTDILWTEFEVFSLPKSSTAGAPLATAAWEYDSPDSALYSLNMIGEPEDIKNPFRSAAPNSRNAFGTSEGDVALPFGAGAREIGLPGLFAANNFFNADRDIDANAQLYTFGQMKFPDQSMYLVDSFAGEVITAPVRESGNPDPYNTTLEDEELQVDFRYNDLCLMLFLDGHVGQQAEWTNVDDLEDKRKIRIRRLDRR